FTLPPRLRGTRSTTRSSFGRPGMTGTGIAALEAGSHTSGTGGGRSFSVSDVAVRKSNAHCSTLAAGGGSPSAKGWSGRRGRFIGREQTRELGAQAQLV